VVAGLGLGVAAAVTVGLGIWSGDNEPGVRTQNLPVATAPPVGPPTTERRPADAPPAVDETGLPDAPGPAPEQAPPGSSTAPDGSWTDPPAEDGTTWQDQDPRPSATTTSPARPGAAPESGR
jgi:hypothetical protein